MGIPYYFASLIRQHKGITAKVHTKITPDVLAIDFNCLIHQYMDDAKPIESIIAALRSLFEKTCMATKFVYIAMDGVVPYGKVVQQRYRRFRIPEKTPVFDRHQISPETPYMKELATAVRLAFPTAILSCTEEPGEGEHKLLSWLKTLPANRRRSICVYGLDADLILLCLAQKELSAPFSFNLLRENTTFNREDQGFSTLSIWKLSEKLDIPIKQYIPLCVMCFGNDFMPSIGMFSLREGGHERALSVYAEARNPDLTTVGGRDVFMKTAVKHELPVLKEKVQKRGKPAERCIVASDGFQLEQKYNLHILDGVRDIRPVVDAYWKTYAWTIQYFTKNEIPDWSWVYPYPDAPLVCQIVGIPQIQPTFSKTQTFSGTAQLQFILPSASLRKTKKRVLFPDEYYDEKNETRLPWMKRYEWESKPRISLPWNPIEKETRIEVWKYSQ